VRLASPFLLGLLLLVPALAYLRRRWGRTEPSLALPSVPDRYLSMRARLAPLAWPTRALCLVGLVLGLGRPQWGFEEARQQYRGIDVMVALDVSSSMFADDIKPNRMEAAKVVTRRFLSGLRQDRPGLVLFSGEALTYSPLTTDLASLAELVDRVQVQMVMPTGTNIEAALLAAAARFDYDDDRTHIVILVTDGEQTVPGKPVEVGARACAAKDVKVYAIGVGSPSGTVIRTPLGLLGTPRALVWSRLDENTLQQIAAVTGGRYWRAETAGQLQGVFDEIARLEKHDLEVNRRMRYEERMSLVVWPALGLLVLDVLLFAVWCRRTL